MKRLIPIFLVGCMALLYFALGPYPPLDSTGAFWAIFIPCFAAVAMFLRNGKAEKSAAPKCALGASAPWLFAVLFLANGALDHSEERRYSTVVVENRYSYWSGLRDTLVVRSWRPGRENGVAPCKFLPKILLSGRSRYGGCKVRCSRASVD
jgi:hypothetical protein